MTDRQWERCDSPEAMRRLAARWLADAGADEVFLLYGDLGAGKTVFAQGLAAAMGLRQDEVQSPTYTIVHEHSAGGRRLLHLDLYRVELEELQRLGISELLAGEGIKVVEWAERLPKSLQRGRRIVIRRSAPGQRELRLLTEGEDIGIGDG